MGSMCESKPPADSAMQAKAEQKLELVQQLIQNIERAFFNDTEQDRMWLRKICDRSGDCMRTLLKILVEQKYSEFACLRCVTLKAVQWVLRAASLLWSKRQDDPCIGHKILVHMVGDALAGQVVEEVRRTSRGLDAYLACNALLLLGELGPKVLPPEDVPLLLKTLVALPESADELVELALRAHAWSGEHRRRLLVETITHPGGQLLGEVLLQVVNRAEPRRRLRAVKVLTGCLSLPQSDRFLYTNDAFVLVELLQRELPNQAADERSFACHADCLRALVASIAPARSHRRAESKQILQDLLEDDRWAVGVREKCLEVLGELAAVGGA